MESASLLERRRAALAWVIRELGIPPSRLREDSADAGEEGAGFISRLRVQKAVFLLKYLGAPLDYEFNMYIRGPYSPELARDYYSMSDEELDRLAPEADELMRGYRDAVKLMKGARPEVLELAATLADLEVTAKEAPEMLGGKAPEEALRIIKPWATDELVREARELLERLRGPA